jgi:hypothetical protein
MKFSILFIRLFLVFSPLAISSYGDSPVVFIFTFLASTILLGKLFYIILRKGKIPL